MSLNVNDFKSKLTGGGARANLFKAKVMGAGVPTELASFMIKAASLPASTVAAIEVPFRGRQIKVAGDRTFAEWSITVINDTDFAIRNAFEDWMKVVNQHDTGVGATNATDYYGSAEITQMSRDGSDLKTYYFVDVWPSEVSAIDLAYDSNDTIEEFTVTLQYNYWTA